MSSASEVSFVIEPHSDYYAPDDSRWAAQLRDLRQQIEREIGGVTREVTPVDGMKGGVETIILALGSAGAITAVVEIFKAWMGRSKAGSISIRSNVDGRVEEYTVTAEGMSADDVRRFMEMNLQRKAQ